jgi:hypothetical protein
MLSVSDLLQDRQLNLRLLNPGSQTQIANPVAWAHPTELPDPAPWLPEHSIILTLGANLNGSPDTQRRLVRNAVLRQCSAIGFGLGVWLDSVPELIREESNKCGLPLVEVPYEVSFAQVIKTIHEHIFFEQNRPLFDANSLLRAITEAYEHSASIEDFMRTVRTIDPCLAQVSFVPVYDTRSPILYQDSDSRAAAEQSRVQIGGICAGVLHDTLVSDFVQEKTQNFYTSIVSLYVARRISDLANEHFQRNFHKDDLAKRLLTGEATHADRTARLNLVRPFVGHCLTAVALRFSNLQNAVIARWLLDQNRLSHGPHFSAQNNTSVFIVRQTSSAFDGLINLLRHLSDAEFQMQAMPVQFFQPDAGIDRFRELFASEATGHDVDYFTKIDSFFDFINQSTSDAEKKKILIAICPEWQTMPRHEQNFLINNLEIHLRHFGRPQEIAKILRITRQSWYQRLTKLQARLTVDIKAPLSIPSLWSFLTIASKARTAQKTKPSDP